MARDAKRLFDPFHFGVCYYPEAWDAKRHAGDIARIAKCGFTFIRMGESAWSYWEPEEGKFQFELFDRVIDLCRKKKVKVILGTPTYCAPAWVSNQYPEVLRWNYKRIPMAHGSRRNLNYTSTKYLELSDRICSALAEHYRGEDQVIAWQLDNEFNCHMDVSYAPSDTIAFRAWLKRKYRTLERLNDGWGTKFWSQTFTAWEQIDLPHPTPTYQNPTQLLDESRFVSDCVVNFAARQAAILRGVNPKWLITHNGLFNNVDGPKLVEQLDFFSHDQYPLFYKDWTDYSYNLVQSRSLSEPFAILEQQAGPGGQVGGSTAYLQRTPRRGEMRKWTWQSVLHGAKLFSYFRWRTCPYGAEQHWHGLLDPDDRDNRRIDEAKQTGQEIRSMPADFFKSKVVRSVGVLADYDNDINDRRINTYILHGAWERGRWLKELAYRHVPHDLCWPASDWHGFKMIIAPHLKIVDRELVAKLDAFVRSGGVLVLTAQSGLKDRNCHLIEATPPGPLRKLAGLEVRDWTTLSDNEWRSALVNESTWIGLNTFVEYLECKSAEPIALWTHDDSLLSGGCAIAVNSVDRGRVYYIGGYVPDEAVRQILTLLQSRERSALKSVINASKNIEAISRRSTAVRYLTLINHGATEEVVEGIEGRDLISRTQSNGCVVIGANDVRVIETAGRPR